MATVKLTQIRGREKAVAVLLYIILLSVRYGPLTNALTFIYPVLKTSCRAINCRFDKIHNILVGG